MSWFRTTTYISIPFRKTTRQFIKWSDNSQNDLTILRNGRTVLATIQFERFLCFEPVKAYKIIVFVNLKLNLLYDFRELEN
jgi:hypothetical protein